MRRAARDVVVDSRPEIRGFLATGRVKLGSWRAGVTLFGGRRRVPGQGREGPRG